MHDIINKDTADLSFLFKTLNGISTTANKVHNQWRVQCKFVV